MVSTAESSWNAHIRISLANKGETVYLHFHPDESKFKASKGYLQRFKDRYGIRKLTLQGESLSARTEEVQLFKDWFPSQNV